MFLFLSLAPVSVQFAQNVSNNEGDSPMIFELVLSGPVNSPFDVEVCTRNGSAIGKLIFYSVQYEVIHCMNIGGEDFIAASANVTFPAGSTSQFFNVTLIDDSNLEPTEEFEVVIKAVHLIGGQQPVPPVVIGANTEVTGIILDNDGILKHLSLK